MSKTKDFVSPSQYINGINYNTITSHTLARWLRKARKANCSLWDEGGQAFIDDVIKTLGAKK